MRRRYVHFDITRIVQAWTGGAPNHGLQLRLADESDQMTSWRRFYSMERGEQGGAPRIDLTYNRAPRAPARLADSTAPTPDGTRQAAAGPFTMSAEIGDDDGEWVDARFEISLDPATGDHGVVWTGSGSSRTGHVGHIVVEARVLRPGVRYRWRVRGDDGSDVGPWSAYQHFQAR
ncbi:DNRLRE domain-containing protein [Nonomuraea sp. NPDC005650]|uniref:DNRLRE domain-containing protein n=1 Tax=Nonomuraea sp. NPDC005650 TaxID=3157045 RepID=UPI0033AD1B8B